MITLQVRYQDRLRATLQVAINDQNGAMVISDHRDRRAQAGTWVWMKQSAVMKQACEPDAQVDARPGRRLTALDHGTYFFAPYRYIAARDTVGPVTVRILLTEGQQELRRQPDRTAALRHVLAEAAARGTMRGEGRYRELTVSLA